MEVGIEDCLHIEFEYNKSKYDRQRDIPHLRTLINFQVPPEGCHRREDLFPVGADKN